MAISSASISSDLGSVNVRLGVLVESSSFLMVVTSTSMWVAVLLVTSMCSFCPLIRKAVGVTATGMISVSFRRIVLLVDMFIFVRSFFFKASYLFVIP